jgi:hypothetical protein
MYLVEDSIVDCQKDYSVNPDDVEFYVHKKIHRVNVVDTWGTEVFTGSSSSSDEYSNTFTYTIPSTWNTEQLSVVAYIYETTDKEIFWVNEYDLGETSIISGLTFPTEAKSNTTSYYANNLLHISNIKENSTLTVYDLTGKIVLTTQLSLEKETVSLQTTSGVYFTNITTATTSQTRKIVIN